MSYCDMFSSAGHDEVATSHGKNDTPESEVPDSPFSFLHTA
jgi:hypothetical protein